MTDDIMLDEQKTWAACKAQRGADRRHDQFNEVSEVGDLEGASRYMSLAVKEIELARRLMTEADPTLRQANEALIEDSRLAQRGDLRAEHVEEKRHQHAQDVDKVLHKRCGFSI